MNIKQKPWFFAILYMVVSLVCEIVLLVVFRLKIPQDTKIIAPILLVLAPLLAAWLGGYRRPKYFAIVALLTAVLTLVITVVTTNLTGIHTGMAEPIINRSLAGLLGAALTNYLIRKSETPRTNGAGAA